MTLVLAVDGGNSKTDVALVAGDGRLLAAVRGPHQLPPGRRRGAGMERLAALVAEAHAQAARHARRIGRTSACTASRRGHAAPTSGC